MTNMNRAEKHAEQGLNDLEHYMASCSELSQEKTELQQRIEELEKGIALYIEISRYRLSTPFETIQKISKITGIKYEEGHIVSAIIKDLEQVLKGKRNE